MTVIWRMAEAKPSAWTAIVISAHLGSMNRPVRNRPCRRSGVAGSSRLIAHRLHHDRRAGDRPAGRAQNGAGDRSSRASSRARWTEFAGLAGRHVLPNRREVRMRDFDSEPSAWPRCRRQRLGSPSSLGVGQDAGDLPAQGGVPLRPARADVGQAGEDPRPAIGRPCSSRTTPPIATPRGKASV